MKKPKFGRNKIQSFIEFYTTFGTLRIGSEANKIFVEVNEVKTFLTDADVNQLLQIDAITEKVVGAGVTADGVKLKDGKVGKTVAHEATSDGLTTGQLTGADQFVTITVATDANDIISLPKGADTPIGTKIRGMIAATGCELRVHPDDATAVKLNNITTNVEAAIPSDTSIMVELISATEWILTATTNLGAVVTAIVPDAVV